MSPTDEIRALARRALADCEEEQQAARAAIIRAEAHLDKHHELMALASRIEPACDDLVGRKPVGFLRRLRDAEART